MFCPHCGNETSQELNYCKRCGGSLYALAPRQETRPAVAPATAWAAGLSMMGVVAAGLGALSATLSELSSRGVPPDVFKVLIIFVSLTVVGSVALLAHFWMYLLGRPQKTDDPPAQLPRPAQAGELGAAQFSPLAAAHPTSVTEQTTRTLESSRQ